MTDSKQTADALSGESRPTHELLLRLDLAMEILEGLDELGLETRSQVEELLARLEQQVADSS